MNFVTVQILLSVTCFSEDSVEVKSQRGSVEPFFGLIRLKPNAQANQPIWSVLAIACRNLWRVGRYWCDANQKHYAL
jgi:hypothetical protein